MSPRKTVAVHKSIFEDSIMDFLLEVVLPAVLAVGLTYALFEVLLAVIFPNPAAGESFNSNVVVSHQPFFGVVQGIEVVLFLILFVAFRVLICGFRKR